MAVSRLALLSEISVGSDNSLPTEIRLFKAGWNATSKGDFLFDDQAAKDVMAAYTRGGVDIMIDLNHDVYNEQACALRSDAQDARGWCKFTVRNGELWTADMTWTPDGAERLSSKKQRYLSPAFLYDEQTRRVIAIENIAICAMPATLDAMPLVAASKKLGDRERSIAVSTLTIALASLAKAQRKPHGSKTNPRSA